MDYPLLHIMESLYGKEKEPKEIILTMGEIAKKFGCSIEQLRIKK